MCNIGEPGSVEDVEGVSAWGDSCDTMSYVIEYLIRDSVGVVILWLGD